MHELHKLHEKTISCSQNINDADMETLLHLVELRDEVIVKMSDSNEPLSQEDKSKLRQITEHDQVIEARMRDLMNEASGKLYKLQEASIQKKKYEQIHSANSFFVDTRN
ncbi:hypothetical protein [Paenibacillus chungangensis]|uniref:Flagellar protein FliT n=1 Tax=Paenibacillus chungangensis TaxID=696535 RepID=A0ABW3HXB6_9BACL